MYGWLYSRRAADYIWNPESDPEPEDPGPEPDDFHQIGKYKCKDLWSGFDCQPKGYRFGVDPNDGMLEEDLYGLLGCRRDATKHEIRAGFLRMSKRFHPDKSNYTNTSTIQHTRFVWIKNAYEVLKDDGVRAYWDHRMWLRRKAALTAWQARAARRAAKVAEQTRKHEAARREEEQRRSEETRRDEAARSQAGGDAKVPPWRADGTPDLYDGDGEESWQTPGDVSSDEQDWGNWRETPKDWWDQRNEDMGKFWSDWSHESWQSEPPAEPVVEAKSRPKKRQPKAKGKATPARDDQVQCFDPEVVLGRLQQEATTNPEITSMLDAQCTTLPWTALAGPVTAPQGLELKSWVAASKFYSFPDAFDITSFIQLVWPGRDFIEIDTIRIACEKCLPGQVIRVPWNPIADPRDPRSQPRVSRRVPPGYGEDPQSKYFHGYSGLKAPLFRAWGALPSPSGAGSKTPMLYTCHYREVPLHTYAEPWSMPFRLEDGTVLWKKFKAVMGISSTRQDDKYHEGKATRRDKYHNQFYHAPGTYEILWTEWVCYETDVRCSIDRTNEFHHRNDTNGLTAYKRRSRQASELIWDFKDKHYTIGKPPIGLAPIVVKDAPQRPPMLQSALELREHMKGSEAFPPRREMPPRRHTDKQFDWRTRVDDDSEDLCWEAPWRTMKTRGWYYGAYNDKRAHENQIFPEDEESTGGAESSGLHRDGRGREIRGKDKRGKGNNKGEKGQKRKGRPSSESDKRRR